MGAPVPLPTTRRSGGPFSRQTLLVGIILIVAVIAGLLLLTMGGDHSGALQQRLDARQKTLIKLVGDGQKNLQDDKLLKLNSELSLVLLSDNNTLTSALTLPKKTDKTITANEADTATFDKLDTARINGQYDTTYKDALTQKLTTTLALMRELNDAAKKKSVKTALSTEYTHLAGYLSQLQQP